MINGITKEQFKITMGEFVDQYGSKPYGEKRVEMIWQEVRQLNHNQFQRVCLTLINNKFAPLSTDFREASAHFISQNRQRTKTSISNQFKRTFNDKERGLIIRAMTKAMAGNEKALEFLNQIPKPIKNIKCHVCMDEGLVFAKPANSPHSADIVFNCNCKGSQNINSYQRWNSSYEGKLIINHRRR